MRMIGMSIMSTLDNNVWMQIKIVIQDVILNRKCQFKQSDILEMIRNKMIEMNIENKALDCAYFQVIFLNTLDYLVEEGWLYLIDDIYIPSEYMILNEYDTKNADLLYLSSPSSCHPIYINLDNLQETKQCNPRDFLLTGGISNYQREEFISPNVSLKEIASLYHSILEEGASKEEAICVVLNYYKIQRLTPMNELGNVLLIEEKKRKLLKRELKKIENLANK